MNFRTRSARQAATVRRCLTFLLLCVPILLCTTRVHAQRATLRGFVTDRSDGQPLESVNVVLRADSILTGTATSRDGLYLISALRPGRYRLTASHVGYLTYVDTLDLAPGENRLLNIALSPEEAALGEVIVEAGAAAGAARVTAGRQTIRPEEIERVPTPDVSGDLASYLTLLPGIVTTGDRGGQLFIRGGDPSQNLVQLDGMLVYEPFHLLGFYSAFPSEVIRHVDLYTGGFGSPFGERTSSVIDVWSRNGNDKRIAGGAGLSPFLMTARLEGPILRDRVSVLASLRQSLVERGAAHLVGQGLPFDFGDAFAKVHAAVTQTSRISASALWTHDRGTLAEDTGGRPPEEIRWRNRAVGLRYLFLPRALRGMADLRLSHSYLRAELGPAAEPVRWSTIRDTQVALDATVFPGVQVDLGVSARFIGISSELGGLFQNVELTNEPLRPVAAYVEPKIDLSEGLYVRPGMRLQYYHNSVNPSFEPRLRVIFERGRHHLSGAAGLYKQEVVGLADRRDAASVFRVWTNIPGRYSRTPRLEDLILPRYEDQFRGRMQRAAHALLGYRAMPAPWIAFSVEGFYKRMSDVFVPEWAAHPGFSTRLQPAQGRSVGFEARLELLHPVFYGFLNYGLSSTRYAAEQAALTLWYGEEHMRFRPPHDRRHQVSALLSTSAFGFDLSIHWQFGSGLPFSRPVAFDGYIPISDVLKPEPLPVTRRVIYERPYNALLPAYHRLDVSLARTFSLGRAEATLQGSLINAYDRRNVFYYDVFTFRRVDQLPLIPSLGLSAAF